MRRPWLDDLRACTVVLVVVYHVFYMFNACGVLAGIEPFAPVQYQDALLPFVYPWFMVLLFVVAGISARYALEKKSAKEFLRARTVKLLVPSTVGLLVWHWITGLTYMSLGGALDAMAQVPPPVLYLIAALSGTGPLWFAQLLWLCSLLLTLLRRLDKGGRLCALCGRCPGPALLLLALPLWGAAHIGNLPVVTTYRLGIYLAAFLLGYLFLSHDAAQAWLCRARLPLLSAALVCGAAYTVIHFGQDYTAAPLLQGLSSNVYAWIMALALLGCSQVWSDRLTGPLRNYLVGSSFGLYVLHYLPVLLSAYALKVWTDLPPLVVYPLCTAAGLLGGLGLWEVFRRIPFLRWSVLGIQKSRDGAPADQ